MKSALNVYSPSVLFLFLISVYFSCGERVTQTPAPAQEPFSVAGWFSKDTIGIFRGVEFGDEQEVLLQMESDTFLTFRSDKLLEYDYPIPLPGKKHYTLKYVFTNKKLSSFSFDAYLGTEEDGELLTNELTDYFQNKYGDYILQMGSLVWTLNTGENFRESYLELKDESAEFGYGKVNITAYAVK